MILGIRIRFQYATDRSLAYSVERLADGLLFDFADSTFKAEPATLTAPLPEDSGLFKGRYKATLAPTPPAQFEDGHYAITVHDVDLGEVASELAAVVYKGDDLPPSVVLGAKLDAAFLAATESFQSLAAEVRKPRPIGLSLQAL